MKSCDPYVILECANAHGGDLKLLKKTIKRFALECDCKSGIKFQAFSFDLISLPDYKDYENLQRFVLQAR